MTKMWDRHVHIQEASDRRSWYVFIGDDQIAEEPTVDLAVNHQLALEKWIASE